MKRAYPERNPFPYIGTITIQTNASLENSSVLGSRTLPVPAIAKLESLTRQYWDRFDPSIASRGQTMALRGDHGTGKTHSLFHIQQSIKSGTLQKTNATTLPLQLYASAQDADMGTLLQSLIHGIQLEDLESLATRFTGTVASEQLQAPSSEAPKIKAASAVLREQPERVSSLFESVAVDRGAVRVQQSNEIRLASRSESPDFARALSFLNGSQALSQTAHRWFTGEQLADTERAQIGVSGNNESTDAKRAILRLIARLCRRAGRPLIVYIDQYENLVLRGGEIQIENVGALRTLVEELPADNAMLVISGNHEAWSSLSIDLQRRIPDACLITCQEWTLREAKNLVKLYVAPPDEEVDFSGEPTDDELYPFNSEGVKRILEYSSGNVRRLLQLAASVFDQAKPKEKIIGGDLVKEFLKSTSDLVNNEATVAASAQRLLLKAGLPFERDYVFGGTKVDFAVLGPNRKPRLLVEISNAIFYRDAAERAVEHLGLIRQLHGGQISTRLALIVMGYVDPGVLQYVEPNVHDLIIYRADTFNKQFQALLDKLPAPDAEPSTESQATAGQLDQMAAQLQELTKAYRAQEAILSERSAALAKQQTDVRRDRWDQIKAQWVSERSKIEERIREIRARREKENLAELEAERDSAERHRLMGWGTGAILVLLVVILLVVLMSYTDSRLAVSPFDPEERLRRVALYREMIIAAVPFLLFFIGQALGFFRTRPMRELADRVSSIKEIERIARKLGQELHRPIRVFLRWILPEWRGPRIWLRSANPHFRLAGALEWGGGTRPLLQQAFIERNSTVRSRLFRYSAGDSDHDKLGELNGTVSRMKDLPEEIGYLVDENKDYAPVLRDKKWLTLAAFHGVDPTGPMSLAGQVVGRSKTTRGISGQNLIDDLAIAAVRGIEALPQEAWNSLSESEIREAAQELSPFDAGGLGNLDDLRVIREVDRFYLFFREVLFYLERDAPTIRPPNP